MEGYEDAVDMPDAMDYGHAPYMFEPDNKPSPTTTTTVADSLCEDERFVSVLRF